MKKKEPLNSKVSHRIKNKKTIKMLKPTTVIFIILSLGLPPHTFPYHYDWAENETNDDDNANNLEQHEKIDISNPPIGPYFDYDFFHNETVMVGHTAYLKCKVKNIGNRTVSWVRHRDINLLTVGLNSYTSDNRFLSIREPNSEEWTLKLKFAQLKDNGIYECQISTTPPKGFPVFLSVVEPITQILGVPEGDVVGEIFINMGSTINITCIVQNLPEKSSMYWTHNNEEIGYDSPRGGVSVITEKGDHTTSYLLIQRARSSDSGQYTCKPSNANPKTVQVHILKGEQPEAMHAGLGITSKSTNGVVYSLSLILLMSQVISGR